MDKYTPSDIAWLILALIIAVLSINLLRQVRIVQRSYGMLAQLNGDGDWVVVGLLTSAIWVFWISFWWSRRPEIGPETVKDFFHLIVMVPRDFIIPVILTSVTPLILVIVRSIIALSTPQDDSDYPSSRPSVVPHLVLSAIGLAADVLTLKAGVLS